MAESQSKIFKDYMDETGYTEDDISSITMIPKSIVGNLVAGKSVVTISLAVQLESALGIPLEDWRLHD